MAERGIVAGLKQAVQVDHEQRRILFGKTLGKRGDRLRSEPIQFAPDERGRTADGKILSEEAADQQQRAPEEKDQQDDVRNEQTGRDPLEDVGDVIHGFISVFYS